jgi:outer membrane protein assembly factor BamB
MVDLLDFPLHPPDADDINFAGRDFGVFRRRYDKYHTGEDWWVSRGGSNFGEPVFNIGHGTVTYADGDGWGRDKGVVIVRHVLASGRTVLSFYGHLDPPSVMLQRGDCVERGQKVGEIGRPRTSPHLHFEIRNHLPGEPGPGYWPSDPTLTGWESPSRFINAYRVSVSPGVEWTRPITAATAVGLGMVGEETYAVVEERRVTGINVTDGSLRWQEAISISVHVAIPAEGLPMFYVASRVGTIQAFQLSQDETVGPTMSWQKRLSTPGTPTLIPLPEGGVMAWIQRRLFAFSPDGSLLWEGGLRQQPWAWAVDEQRLYLSTLNTNGSLWSVDESGLVETMVQKRGRPLPVANQVLLYGDDGLYRLQSETPGTELLYALPEAYPRPGELLLMPDGGVLLAHADPWDRRLVALTLNGEVRWQRSYKGVVRGEMKPMVVDGRMYVLADGGSSAASETAIYALEPDGSLLTKIFSGGSRGVIQGSAWTDRIGQDRLLVHVRGTGLVALDLGVAMEAAGGR